MQNIKPLKPLQMDFDSYIRQVEPSKKENGKLWQTAIGLQQVDGLTPSVYLYEIAKKYIEGELSIEEVKENIATYYETKIGREEINEDEKEADIVSVRIREILAEKTFIFTPALLCAIYKRLFTGLFYKIKAGIFRDYNISKKEWILDGESVFYASADMIKQTLEYDFEKERNFDYSRLNAEEKIKHLARFIANIWQIHPFGEGNTRTTAVFTIKYLNSLGYKVSNEPFEKNSLYFRNSLVRANYTNMQNGIFMNTEFLEKFFKNLLLGENHELKNRYVHLRYSKSLESEIVQKENENITVNDTVNITQNITVKLSQNQQKIIELIKKNPAILQDQIAQTLGIARETVNRNMKKLQENKIIKRIGADKNGYWQIL